MLQNMNIPNMDMNTSIAINLWTGRIRKTMKICIPATDATPDALIDSSFGRCKYLQFIDTETGKFYHRENTYREENSGAGTQVAQMILSEGASVVIGQEVGPKAAKVLDSGSVETYSAEEIQVREALEQFQQGKLEPVS